MFDILGAQSSSQVQLAGAMASADTVVRFHHLHRYSTSKHDCIRSTVVTWGSGVLLGRLCCTKQTKCVLLHFRGTLLHCCPRLSQNDCCRPFPCIHAQIMQHCQHPHTASNLSNLTCMPVVAKATSRSTACWSS
jgi:hypothetical protein